jgi:hypothetical protein
MNSTAGALTSDKKQLALELRDTTELKNIFENKSKELAE